MLNYNGLWHRMLDMNVNKTELCEKTGISSSTMAKMGKNEMVSLDVLERVCEVLQCDIGDIVSIK